MDAQEAMQVAKLHAAKLENQIAELKARMAEQAELTQLGPAAVAALEAQVRDADSGAKAQAAENSRLEIKLIRSRRRESTPRGGLLVRFQISRLLAHPF